MSSDILWFPIFVAVGAYCSAVRRIKGVTKCVGRGHRWETTGEFEYIANMFGRETVVETWHCKKCGKTKQETT